MTWDDTLSCCMLHVFSEGVWPTLTSTLLLSLVALPTSLVCPRLPLHRIRPCASNPLPGNRFHSSCRVSRRLPHLVCGRFQTCQHRPAHPCMWAAERSSSRGEGRVSGRQSPISQDRTTHRRGPLCRVRHHREFEWHHPFVWNSSRSSCIVTHDVMSTSRHSLHRSECNVYSSYTSSSSSLPLPRSS